jgi:uncharacterized oligopeptide transporter (OPT) family protein
VPAFSGFACLAINITHAGVFIGADPSDEASVGVLFSGGLITGEALMGILLALPIVVLNRMSAGAHSFE